MSSEVRDDTPVSQLVIDIVDVRRRAGTQRVLRVVTCLDSLEAGEFSVVNGRLDIDLVIEAVVATGVVAEGRVAEGVVAGGTARGQWTGPCRRCLEAIVAPLEFEVHEIFEYRPTEGETWPIENDRIDLAPVLREAALLSLPLVPLCRDDCSGPEPARFPATVEADLTKDAPALDSRWAVLDELRFDD